MSLLESGNGEVKNNYESFMDYAFNISGGAGASVGQINNTLPIGKFEVIDPSWASYSPSTKKITISDNGYYDFSISFRAMISMDAKSSSVGGALYSLELFVAGTKVAHITQNGSTGSNSGFHLIPYYNDTDGAVSGSATVPYSSSAGILTANGLYAYRSNVFLQPGAEIYLRSFNSTQNYSSPTRTAPEGSARIQKVSVNIFRVG